ncbi:striatin-interacting protein 1 homolog isoform X2 [Syngnathoides biaculeatus]|uniref:striatin-interacting protein 1 homolog isoform X2 n=1 Tax=Syngnathoides biaculeatus TaxID=300417 RepID=UPI002ADD6557|nr:striatin-interacting protein 1 homolog isoform X2 [Syngnathoides biaculeatus]
MEDMEVPLVNNLNDNSDRLRAKGKDVFKDQHKESESSMESPNLEFEYGDTDAITAELSELFSYTEEPEFALNRDYFEEDFRSHARGRRWIDLSPDDRRTYVMRLLDALEVTDRDKRLKVARSILYLAQGVFDECDTEADLLRWSRQNVFLLYDMGIFTALLELLSMEIDNNQACSSAVRKPAISLADSTELRVLLSIMYLMVETIRVQTEDDGPQWRAAREAFKNELAAPLYNGEPFALLLFSMVTKFCSMSAPHFPMKKVLLLLWKTILFTLGGFEELQAMKVLGRERLRLPPLPEDSITVVRAMRAASPPASAMELIEQQQQQKRGRRSRRPLVKQDSLDTYNERDPFKNDDVRDDEEDPDDPDGGMEGEVDPLDRDVIIQPPPPLRPPTERVNFPKGLPWAPKVREKDIEHFLETSRNKFIGFTLGNDTETLVGLPRPIHESVKTLKQHKYVSIAEVQMKREEELQQCPLSLGEEEVEETPAEVLYLGMLPNLSQYVIALLKLLLAAAPTSKAKTDSINILADVLPEEMPITVLQSMKLGIDVNRHKEIIVKAISALLLLLLKHFKLNHVYQFEIVSQHLVFANCIPLILKFFNQNIMSYISAKNSICVLDFPHCAVHEMPELTAESLEAGDNAHFCWRNLFSCINLLRILNKLTKWKHSRTMMLVVFKSAPILKRALKVKQAMMQLYVLKLLKIQTKYLGRQWRKSNMKTMSAIYQKISTRGLGTSKRRSAPCGRASRSSTAGATTKTATATSPPWTTACRAYWGSAWTCPTTSTTATRCGWRGRSSRSPSSGRASCRSRDDGWGVRWWWWWCRRGQRKTFLSRPRTLTWTRRPGTEVAFPDNLKAGVTGSPGIREPWLWGPQNNQHYILYYFKKEKSITTCGDQRANKKNNTVIPGVQCAPGYKPRYTAG